MLIDISTLTDLDIDDAAQETTPIIDFLSRGSMPETRHRLRDMLLHPLSSVDSIRSRQLDLRILAGMAEDAWPSTLRPLMERVELYLVSRREPYPRRSVVALVRRLRNHKNYVSTIEGLQAVRALARFLAAFSTMPALSERTGGELANLVAQIQEFVALPSIAALVAEQRPPHIVRRDGVIRVGHRQQLQSIVDVVYTIDAFWALARLGNSPGFAYPEFVSQPKPLVELEELFHPLVRNACRNDLSIGRDYGLIFLTGPNMAGKSTYLRACALAVILAHVGAPVPARRATLTLFDRVFAALAVRDSLARSESYYLAEVRRVGRLADYLEKGEVVFSVLDEIFKGTNVHDALEATELVLLSLLECATANTIVASHLVEAATAVGGGGRVGFFHFDAMEHDGRVSFNYRCSPGVSNQRLGMTILESEGVAASLRRLAGARDGDDRLPIT